jgi:hydrogenase-4 component B
MIPPIVLSELIVGLFVTLGIGVGLGFFSKKAAYLIGIVGSVLGVLLSLFVLIVGDTLVINLWQITHTTSAQIAVSQLSSYFLLISSLVWIGTCLYSVRYDDDYPNALSSLLLLTILSMVLILVSGDAITFLIGWESMTIASFFMILEGKGDSEGVRNAAFLFLAFGEGSSVFIMLSFAGLFSSVGSFNFLGITSVGATGWIASWVFVTAFIGFALKMGIVPFHMSEWLPIAHSSAPSNASALLSATLTLMGVYGLITVISHLPQYELWWGWLALVVGGISALLGALFASVSEHTKGLPAYSTIENNGLIVIAIGAYLLASYDRLALLADFAMIAALYHAFSHSIAKASLFLINGWVSKIKRSFDLNSHNEAPKGNSSVRFAGLFTAMSLAAVPPLAGFVSEWMILEVLFQSFMFHDPTSQIVGTLVGAVTALAAGISVVAMTKVYGFGMLWSLNHRDQPSPEGSSRAGALIGVSLVYFFVLILSVGVAAPSVFFLASSAASQLLKVNVFGSFVTGLLGVPAYFVILSGNPFGGYSPTFTAIFMLAFLSIPFLITRLGGPWRTRKVKGWFAGADEPDNQVEFYNSFGYSAPIRIMFRFLFRTKENVARVGSIRRTVTLSPVEYLVEVEVFDVFKRPYEILSKWTMWLSAYVSRKVMPGKLGLYIIYIMAAFVFVLLYALIAV